MELYNRLFHRVIVMNSIETMNTIISEKKSVSRYGDGEFNLLLNENIKFQKKDEGLRKKLLDVIIDKDKNKECLICIPYAMCSLRGFTARSSFFWLNYFAQKRKRINSFLSNDVKYYDAQITRFYINRKNKQDSKSLLKLWKSVWNNRNVLVVEGSKSRFGVMNSLFDNAKSIRRIICPSENAYKCYDEIFQSVLHTTDFDICILALGPTATVLAYDLSKEGIWTIDSGNMDMEYEWMLRGVKKQIAIEGKYTMEAKDGTVVHECYDNEYRKQVIKYIGHS